MENTLNPVAADIATDKPPVRQLTRAQRRVLGVLVEKAFTTSEYYPLTLKSATTGCNQKSNRSPITNYSEDSVEEIMDELRQLGLVAVVHTESGRTERYRHFMRQRYPFSETQLAIITELLLRGHQQLGELRSRASRMVPIESLEALRSDLRELSAQGFVHSGGPLERRGIEVDHGFYAPDEQPAFNSEASTDHSGNAPAVKPRTSESDIAPVSVHPTASASPERDAHVSSLERECADLRDGLRETRQEVDSLREQVAQLSNAHDELRRDLGC